ncbi:MAG TPA: flagellar biosynthesis protein FlhF [Solimonas sp.]|nr:flagellar biosynthesis protein FlhF [Solimonas sp.]
MKIKRFLAKNMREAIRMVREEQGPDAVILSNHRVADGIEVVAATDYDAALIQMAVRRAPEPAPAAAPVAPAPAATAPTAAPRTAKPAAPRAAKPAVPVAPTLAPAPARMPAMPAALPTVAPPEVQQLRREIGGMRRMLETQMASLVWRDMKDNQPERMAALRAMSSLGIEPRLAREIVGQVPQDGSAERARYLPLGLLARRIAIAETDAVLKGGVFALVGPTGVGKTTTIAKLAARWAAHHGTRDLALVTTDHYRVGAQEQLFTYGRLLGAPVHTAANGAELNAVLAKLADRKLVLIDTAGMAPRDQQLAAQFAELKSVRRSIRTWLVLNATTQASDLEDILRRFSPASPQGAVLTKMDEATRIGGALSALIRHRLPLAYLCDGQRVPEDLHIAQADQLVLRAMQLARLAPATIADSTLALQFGAAHGGN